MKNAPDKEEVENFWWEIYGKEVQHNGEAHWIENQYQQNPRMEWSPLCEKDVANALSTMLNWKAPGRDQIANFELKQLTVTHKHIAALFEQIHWRRSNTGLVSGRSNIPYSKQREY